MREIKFRAWDEQTKKMVYDFKNTDRTAQLNEEGWLVKSCWHTLMQYTGLKDKNGKEIFESDVVKVYDEELRVVKFENAFWQLDLIDAPHTLGGFGTQIESGHKPLYRYGESHLEVVGNIYKNPELCSKTD